MHLILNFKIFYKAVSAHQAHSRLQGDPSTLCTSPHTPSWPTKRESWCSTTLVTAGTAAPPTKATWETLQSHYPLRNMGLPSLSSKPPEPGGASLLHRREAGWLIHSSPRALSFGDGLRGAQWDQGSRKHQC